MKGKLSGSFLLPVLLAGTAHTASAAEFQWLRTHETLETPNWTNSLMWTVNSGEPMTNYPTADDIARFGMQSESSWFVNPIISGRQAIRGIVVYSRSVNYWRGKVIPYGNTDDATLAIGVDGIKAYDDDQWNISGIANTVKIELATDQTWYNSGAYYFVDGAISGDYSITRTGDTSKWFRFSNSGSTFSGGLMQNGGLTSIGANGVVDSESGQIVSGPVGTGTITFNGGIFQGHDNVIRTLYNDVFQAGDMRINNITFAEADGAGFVINADDDNLLRVLNIGGTVSIDRAITVAGEGENMGLLKTGDGTLELRRANAYTGPTRFEQGTVRVWSFDALGVAPATFVANQLQFAGGFLRLSESHDVLASTRGIHFSGGGIDVDEDKIVRIATSIDGGGVFEKRGNGLIVVDDASFSGALSLNAAGGTMEFNGGVTSLDALYGTKGATLVLNLEELMLVGDEAAECVATVTGGVHIVYAGTGTQAFSADNSFTGGLTALSGTIAAHTPAAFGTGPFTLNGSTLDICPLPGVWEGRLSGAREFSAPNPKSTRTSNFRMLQTTSGWGGNETWVYTGQIYIHEDPATPGFRTVTLGINIDDNAQMWLNGEALTIDGGYNTTEIATRTLAAGWHDIEARGGNAGGGAGPTTGDGWNTGIGFGIDWEGRDVKTVGNFTKPVDDGSGTLLRTSGSGTPLNVTNFTWQSGTISTILTDVAEPITIDNAFTKTGSGPYVFDFNGTGESGKTYLLATFNTTNFSSLDFSATNLPASTEGPFDAIFTISGNQLFVKTIIRRATLLLIR